MNNGVQISISWDPVLNAGIAVRGYRVYKSSISGSDRTFLGETTRTNFLYLETEPADYIYSVSTVNTDGYESDPTFMVHNLSNTVPIGGTLSLVNEPSSTTYESQSPSFKWVIEEDHNFRDYVIRIKSADGATLYRELYTSNRTYTYALADNVADGFHRNFMFTVAAVNTNDIEADPLILVVNNPVLSAPTGVAVSVTSPTVSVTFDPVLENDYSGTEVHVSTTNGFTPSSGTLLKDVTTNNFTFTQTAGTYYIRIGHFDRMGRDSIQYSAQTTVVVNNPGVLDTTAPAVPTGLVVTSDITIDTQGNHVPRLNIDWTANTEADLAGYIVSIKQGTGVFRPFPTDENSYEARAVSGASYTIRVRSKDRFGNLSAWSSTATVTGAFDTGAPATPSGLTATAGFKLIALKWTANTETDLSHYDVFVSSSNTPPLVGTAATEQVSMTFWTHTSLAPSVTRYYWIRAVDHSGNKSAWTSVVSATTQQVEGPDITAGVITGSHIAADTVSSTNLQAGSIVADKIDAEALRGKKIIGGWLADAGALVSVAVAKPVSLNTVTTITLDDTTDFSSAGGSAMVINTSTNFTHFIRYTGKTATTLTGASGINYNIKMDDIIVPTGIPIRMLPEYDGSGTIAYNSLNWTADAGMPFPSSGSIFVFGRDVSYRAGTYLGASIGFLTSVSGLSTFTPPANKNYQYVVEASKVPEVSLTSGSLYTTIAVGSLGFEYFSPNGGEFIAVLKTGTGYITGRYSNPVGATSYTIDVANTTNGDFSVPSTGTYKIIPISRGLVIGSGNSIIEYDNFGVAILDPRKIEARIARFSSFEQDYALEAFGAHSKAAIRAASSNNWPYEAASKSSLPSLDTLGAFGIYRDSVTDRTFMGYSGGAGASNTGNNLLQTIGLQQHFKVPTGGATDSYINFDDTTNTYAFTASGTLGDANLLAATLTTTGNTKVGSLTVGDAPNNASRVINNSKTFTADGGRFGIYNDIYITSETLTSAKSWSAQYNSIEIDNQNATTFNTSTYGSYNVIQVDQGSNTTNIGGYHAVYAVANMSCSDATFNRFDDARGMSSLLTVSGNTARVANGYGLFVQVNAAGTSGTSSVAIDNAYGLYVNFIASITNRTITNSYQLYLASSGGLGGLGANRWGIYQATDWQNFFNGSVQMTKALAVGVTRIIPANGGTTAVDTVSSQIYFDHGTGVAGHTITLPLSADVKNGHEITFAARAGITALTVGGNGSTVRGAPTTLAADGFFTMRWMSVGTPCWYRCG